MTDLLEAEIRHGRHRRPHSLPTGSPTVSLGMEEIVNAEIRVALVGQVVGKGGGSGVVLVCAVDGLGVTSDSGAEGVV